MQAIMTAQKPVKRSMSGWPELPVFPLVCAPCSCTIATPTANASRHNHFIVLRRLLSIVTLKKAVVRICRDERAT